MIDELQFGVQLLGEVGWALRDRLRANALARLDGIALDLDQMDAAWFTSALAEARPGIVVRSAERSGGHSGTTTRERFRLEYEQSEAAAGMPREIFAKVTPRDFATQIFAGLFELGRSEVRFYRDISEHVPIAVPRVWCARTARHGGRFALLLEDLAVRGCRFTQGALPIEEARAVVRMFGRLHAEFWESPRFGREWSWLRSYERRRRPAVERMISARANEPSIRRFGEVLSADVRRHSKRVHEHREALERWWSRGPRTLIHGDSHVGNMFFMGQGDATEAGLLDWQVVQIGQGIRDVTYFMTNSLEASVRREHEHALLDLYLETLREGGVTSGVDAEAGGAGLDRAALWEGYRGHVLYTWISCSVTAATPGLQPEHVARAAMQRVGEALDDLESFSLLDEIVAKDSADVS